MDFYWHHLEEKQKNARAKKLRYGSPRPWRRWMEASSILKGAFGAWKVFGG